MTNNRANKRSRGDRKRLRSFAAPDTKREAAMKILVVTLVLTSWTVSANQALIVDGTYLRYEGGEFESAFFPCMNSEVWSIEGGTALDSLVDYYRNSKANGMGEIRALLELVVSPVNESEAPNSHFDAVAEVTAIISISEDKNEISLCRDDSL